MAEQQSFTQRSDALFVARRLTPKQKEALCVAFEKGGAWYGLAGSRAGGSYSRMCERLASLGLVERSGPHQITAQGLGVLRCIREIEYARHGSSVSMIRLEAVEAALTKATTA
jgi:hypothetical protein